MSHYTVAVLTKTNSEQEVEELLIPFDENLEYDEDEDEEEYHEAKWDWWVIGGRWSNFLKDKKGNFHNTLQIKDWDYTDFNTYAVLTSEGEWLEPGPMGWWGISLSTPEEKEKWINDYTNLIKSFDKNLYVTLVDCHI